MKRVQFHAASEGGGCAQRTNVVRGARRVLFFCWRCGGPSNLTTPVPARARSASLFVRRRACRGHAARADWLVVRFCSLGI